MTRASRPKNFLSRRQLVKTGLYGMGAASLLPFSPLFPPMARGAEVGNSGKILVIFEISGGNDGLNTVVPYADDSYYRQRPKIGLRPEQIIKIDGHFGLNPGMIGFERLYKDGHLAIVHGTGYENPSFSHSTSAAYWHTGAPNSGSPYGWVGRVADAILPGGTPNSVVNIGPTQSLAVQSRDHRAVVFDDPEKFKRERFVQELPFFENLGSDDSGTANASQSFLHGMVRSARDASAQVKDAWQAYNSPVDYGIAPYDLNKVAALIDAGFPAQLYYAGVRNGAFDTHVYQNNLHERLLTYVSDCVAGFLQDMERIGRADDVAILIFSEFGRRVPENANLGTDHGAAGLMFVAGQGVTGGHYGTRPSLTELDAGDNLIYTTDFRRVYASAIEGWLGHADSSSILGDRFETFPIFG